MSDAAEVETLERTLGLVVNAHGALPADAFSYGPAEIAVRRLPAGSASDLECLTADGKRFVLSYEVLASETSFQAALLRHAGWPLVLRALRRPSGQLIAAQSWAGAIAEMLGNGDRLAETAILLPGAEVEELLGEVVLGAERVVVLQPDARPVGSDTYRPLTMLGSGVDNLGLWRTGQQL